MQQESTAEPIVLEGRLTEQDVVDLREAHDRLLIRRSIRWLAGVFLTLISAICVWGMLQTGLHVVAILFVLASLYLLLFWRAERRYSVQRFHVLFWLPERALAPEGLRERILSFAGGHSIEVT